jgi:hypothetical protein
MPTPDTVALRAADEVMTMVALPLSATVQFRTIAATATPLIGRGRDTRAAAAYCAR